MNAIERKVNQSRRRTYIVQLHTSDRYFKSDTSEVGAVLGLLSKNLDAETSFDTFRYKLKD